MRRNAFLWGSGMLSLLVAGCGNELPILGGDAGTADVAADVATTDRGATDVPVAGDTGTTDSGAMDATPADGGGMDATPTDGGDMDAVTPDGPTNDGATADGATGDGTAVDVPPADVPLSCGDAGTACSGVCVNTATDPMNCGACGTACTLANATAGCSAGACTIQMCASGFADCDGMAANGCETNLNSSAANCGACGHGCTATNATAACTGGVCGIGTCNTGYGDCNDNAADGCEVNLATTVASCGACTTACNIPNGTEACTAGACAVGACNTGFANCDGAAANGCETTLGTNTNCGGCGMGCAAGTHCSSGTCVSSCPTGTTFCATSLICTNVQADVSNCGTCDHACPTPNNGTATCTTGTCGLVCNAGFADCDGSAANGCEVNLNTSAGNCNACGNVCSLPHTTAACSAGSCTVATCATGYADCNSTAADGCETNLNTTVTACGACGTACSIPHATAACTAGACGIAACDAGWANCDGSVANGCETSTTTNTNCGTCGTTCAAGTHCAGAAGSSSCVSSCPSGTTYCAASGVCANFQSDTANCGMCGTVCLPVSNAVAVCNSGACAFNCNAGYADCNGNAADGCEANLGSSTTNCGSCGTACTLANARAACSSGGCTIAACNAGFADCNGNPADGCEVDLTTTTSACGTCSNICNVPHSTPSCAGVAGGTCGIAACATGYGNCDGTTSNGCEVNLNTSVTNCGACGTACTLANALNTCTTGTCTIRSCNAGYGNCDGTTSNGCEVNLNTSLANCGGCGTTCALANATPACTGGVCGIGSCNAGYGNCDGTVSNGCERALNTNNHCGACGNVCAAGTYCNGGSCVSACPTGTTYCAATGNCVNLATDPNNCSGCGVICATYPHTTRTCASSSCAWTCTGGWSNCDGNIANGCETNITGSATNCGACGTVCNLANATPYCAAGTCAIATCNNNYANCDGVASNGCEVNLSTSTANCGTCGRACRAGQTCTRGACN